MHIELTQLRNLAHSYVKNERLNDEQLQWKRHMGQCDACYENFCTEFTILKSLLDIGFITDEALNDLEEESSEKVCLKLRIADKSIKFIKQMSDSVADAWNFFQLPQLAVSRGETKQQIVYQSPLSEYSCIRREEDKIIVQLEKEYYPVERLQVKYTINGQLYFKEFEYDEKMDCYKVILVEQEIIEVEIVEKG